MGRFLEQRLRYARSKRSGDSSWNLGVSVSPQIGKMRGRGADGGQDFGAQPWVRLEPGLELEVGGSLLELLDPHLPSCTRTRSGVWAPALARILGSLGHKAGQGPREPPTQEM